MITSRVTSCVRHYAQVGWHPADSPATIEGLISRVSGMRSLWDAESRIPRGTAEAGLCHAQRRDVTVEAVLLQSSLSPQGLE